MTAAAENTLSRPLQALARLLDYPDAELQANVRELAAILGERSELTIDQAAEARTFCRQLGETQLLTVQAEHVETFDRGRKVSLHVFEHVYGESRDRGPAMVELSQAFQQHGLVLETGELPDYLPVLMEFCAQLPEADARAWLVEAGHVLQIVHVRLAERNSRFAVPLRLLMYLLDIEPYPERLTDMADKEKRDDTASAIDRVWDEAPVTFGPSESHTNDGATRQEPDESTDQQTATASGQGR